MSLVLSTGLLLGGLLAMAFAMDRHQDVLSRHLAGPRVRRSFRVAGALAITLSMVCTLATLGCAMGTLTWFGLFTPLALAVSAGLTWLSSGARHRARVTRSARRADDRLL